MKYNAIIGFGKIDRIIGGIIYVAGMGRINIFSTKTSPQFTKEEEGTICVLIKPTDGSKSKIMIVNDFMKEIIPLDIAKDIDTKPMSKLLRQTNYVYLKLLD